MCYCAKVIILNLKHMLINKLLKWQNTHICLKWQKVAKHFQLLLKKKGGAIVDMNYNFQKKKTSAKQKRKSYMVEVINAQLPE